MDMMLHIIGMSLISAAVWSGMARLFQIRVSFQLSTLLGMPFGLAVLIFMMIDFVEKYGGI